MAHHDLVVLLVGLGVLLGVARVLGALATRFGQPAVVGELVAGVLLGPTLLGAVAPGALATLFPPHGNAAIALDGVTRLGVLLFLFAAGIEVDLSTVFRQGRSAGYVSVGGIVVPFVVGVSTALLAPYAFGWDGNGDAVGFALFFGTALSISALPVIAKTLLDLNLFRSDLGMLVIAAAVVDDLVGWIVFALILASLGVATTAFSPLATALATLAFTAFFLTAGRALLHRALPTVQRFSGGETGMVAFAVALAFLGGAFTEWIGVHALFGAFLSGVALGDSSRLREETRATIESFVAAVFAPIFFASIGLRVDFARHFDVGLCLAVIVIASVGKLVGAGLAARWSGMSPRESLAVGLGMNSRGAMEIVLGALALRNGLIGERLFVALVVMALVTSMASGPLMERVLRRGRPRRFTDHLAAGAFVPRLRSPDAMGAIRELAGALCASAGLDPAAVGAAVLEREETQTTALGDGVAAPHARLAGLAGPLVALGISRRGIDFDAPDGEPVHIVLLLLTPREDDGAQIELLGDIAKSLLSSDARQRLAEVGSFEEAMAALGGR